MILQDLVGKQVNEVHLNANNEYINFLTPDGNFCFYTEGDCCSESWINHISGIESLLGNFVVKVDQIDMTDISDGEPGFSGKQEVDRIYSFKIFTSQGVCELEMRNSSNGYYGGSLQSTTLPYGEIMRVITENF